MALADAAGKFAVDHGISAVHLRQRFFKVHVIGVLADAVAHAEGDDLPIYLQHKTFQSKRLVVVKGLADGDALAGEVGFLPALDV